MPGVRIPVYDQQTLPQSAALPRAQIGQSAGVDITPIGNALLQAGVQFTDLQQARRISRANDLIAKGTMALDDLEFKYNNDTDYTTAHQRYSEEVKQLRQQLLKGENDPGITQLFSGKYELLSASKGLSVRRSAWKKEVDYNQGALITNLDNYANLLVTAKNDIEKKFYTDEAALTISDAVAAGWIGREEGVKQQKRFLGKVDEAKVRNELLVDPDSVALKLDTDATYAANFDPVQRVRWTETAYRRAEAKRRDDERNADKLAKTQSDDLLREAERRRTDGKLNRAYIEKISPQISPGEYRRLLDSLNGGASENNTRAYSKVQEIIYDRTLSVDEKKRALYAVHHNRLITDSTLSSSIDKAVAWGRIEGPKSEYELTRSYITGRLQPSPVTKDPAPFARQSEALRGYDDYASSGKRTDKELRDKGDELIRTYQLIDMADIARRTGLGARNNPERVLKDVITKGLAIENLYRSGKISEADYKKEMNRLNEVRKSAEKARDATK